MDDDRWVYIVVAGVAVTLIVSLAAGAIMVGHNDNEAKVRIEEQRAQVQRECLKGGHAVTECMMLERK